MKPVKKKSTKTTLTDAAIYGEFIQSKIPRAESLGFEPPSKPHISLKPHQGDIAIWMLRGGRRLCAISFGLGKSRINLQLALWIIADNPGKKYLIVAPLGVRREFIEEEGPAMGMTIQYCRTDAEVAACETPFVITNYERVRDGDIALTDEVFAGAALDEGSVLRSYGSLTYQNFLTMFRPIKYRFVFTATPSPNRHKELIHYGAFLGVMDSGDALTRFFKRDSTQANNLTLYPAQEEQFWLWLSSWAVFLQSPSDLGYDATGYDLPPVNVHWHRIEVDHKKAWNQFDSWGQAQLLQDQSNGLAQLADIKRDTIVSRLAFARELISKETDKHWIIWHDLEEERRMIERSISGVRTAYGSQELEEREAVIGGFSRGEFAILGTKPSIAGSGTNLQKHCADAIFLGSTFKFNDFIQSMHRIVRFGQKRECNIHIIFTESEDSVIETLQHKWAQHTKLVEKMVALLKTFKLNLNDMKLTRKLGCDRAEVTGEKFRMIRNDTVMELMPDAAEPWPDNSVDLIVTSIPFGNQYEYSPNFSDMGYNPNNEEFFKQMDFLIPNLLRVLKPGRVACIHVKDRIRFGNVTGLGMPTIDRFSDKTADRFEKHGFKFFGRITIDTDVVRENNQTYRLGWTENSKDSTKMGCGMPEYVLLLRKIPSDTSTAYADTPVSKDKEDYTRAQWQIDASSFYRSSGNRLPDPQQMVDMPMDVIGRIWREYCRKNGYDYDQHIKIGKELERCGKLPSSFMLFPPISRNPDVWTDIARMRTLNSEQSKRNEENHVCLASGSLVLTREFGYIEIEEVEPGDHVFTHKGRWMPVLAKRCNGIAETIRICGQGVADLRVTHTHKLWARRSYGVREKENAKRNNPDWMEAKDVFGSYLNLQIPPEKDSELTAHEWWIVGRWLGDGHRTKRRTNGKRGGGHSEFIISCNHNEADDLTSILGIHAGFRHTVTATQINLIKLGKKVRNVLNRCGEGASEKRIPGEGLCLNKEKSESLMLGYLSSDGHYVEKHDRITASSVSRRLLLGLAIVAQRARGVVASVYAGRPEREGEIQGRRVSMLQDWIFSFRDSKGFCQHGWIDDLGAWKKVRKIEDAGEAQVWDLQVAEDSSFTAEGCIVHNCPLQEDIIKRLVNRYSNSGEVVFDPFAGIGSVPYYAIHAHRVGWGCELSADYWKCAVGYCEQAEAEASMPTLFDLMEVAK